MEAPIPGVTFRFQVQVIVCYCLASDRCIQSGIPGDDNKRDPDMDYIGCLGSNGQHSQILPFLVTFIVVTRYSPIRTWR